MATRDDLQQQRDIGKAFREISDLRGAVDKLQTALDGKVLAFYVDWVHAGIFQQTNIAVGRTMSFIVPAKSTYYVTGNNGLLAWNELR